MDLCIHSNLYNTNQQQSFKPGRNSTASSNSINNDRDLQIESNNHWTSLNRPEFTANLLLETVTITANTINALGVTLKNHPFLRELRLCDNPTLDLQPDDIENLNSKSLRTLHLDGCDLSELPTNSFAHLPALVELNLDRNHLVTVPQDVLLLTNTTTISLSSNTDFNFLPNANVLRSQTLSEFRCNDCGINVIYDVTFDQLPALMRLELNRNQITVVYPKSFGGLGRRLQVLQLNQNRLTTFPITSLRAGQHQLRELCLDGNNFTPGIGTDMLKQRYATLNLRGQCPRDASLQQLDDIEAVRRPGISDAFIATYLVMIVVVQGVFAALLIGLCLRQVFGKKDPTEFEYSNGVLNDSEVYRYV